VIELTRQSNAFLVSQYEEPPYRREFQHDQATYHWQPLTTERRLKAGSEIERRGRDFSPSMDICSASWHGLASISAGVQRGWEPPKYIE